jgi:NADP-dependent 3-hydroxy acid dehydrogenase YdfG
MRVAVITGGSDGIGAEIARQLASRDGAGIALVLAARDRDKLEQVAGQCTAFGAQALAVPTDVGDQASAAT